MYVFQFCRDFLALNVYVALCYYKMDYYDVSQEVLAVYLQSIPDSTIALNLKACNHFRLYNGKAAEVRYRHTNTIFLFLAYMKAVSCIITSNEESWAKLGDYK